MIIEIIICVVNTVILSACFVVSFRQVIKNNKILMEVRKLLLGKEMK